MLIDASKKLTSCGIRDAKLGHEITLRSPKFQIACQIKRAELLLGGSTALPRNSGGFEHVYAPRIGHSKRRFTCNLEIENDSGPDA
jgi:hypothetical protein